VACGLAEEVGRRSATNRRIVVRLWKADGPHDCFGRTCHLYAPVNAFRRSPMLMPLLARLTDSGIEEADRVVAQGSNRVKDDRGVLQEVGLG